MLFICVCIYIYIYIFFFFFLLLLNYQTPWLINIGHLILWNNMIGLFDLLQAYCKHMLVIIEFSIVLYSIFNNFFFLKMSRFCDVLKTSLKSKRTNAFVTLSKHRYWCDYLRRFINVAKCICLHHERKCYII